MDDEDDYNESSNDSQSYEFSSPTYQPTSTAKSLNTNSKFQKLNLKSPALSPTRRISFTNDETDDIINRTNRSSGNLSSIRQSRASDQFNR